MMRYNKKISEELLNQADLLSNKIKDIQKDLEKYPKGNIQEKKKGNNIYYYYVEYIPNENNKYIYLHKEDVDNIKKLLLERKSKENLLKKYKKESEDLRNTVIKKRYIPSTMIVINFLEDERQRSIRMLKAYRMEEIEALSIKDDKKQNEYKYIADNIEKSINELNRLLKVG